MTETERRPGAGNRGDVDDQHRAGEVSAEGIPRQDRPMFPMLDMSSGLLVDHHELALLAEVHRIVGKATALAGPVHPVGSRQWWAAEPLPRLAALLVLAERHLLADPDRLAVEQLKAAAVAVSTGMDWSGAAHSIAYDPHAVLVARRAELGPLFRVFDPVAAAAWVETGSAEPAA